MAEEAKEDTPAVADPFDRIQEIWSEKDPKEQRAKTAEIFNLQDGSGVCRESLLVDYSFLTLLHAYQRQYSRNQTKFFYELMCALKELIADPKSTLEQAITYLKGILLTPLADNKSAATRKSGKEISEEEVKEEAGKSDMKSQDASPSIFTHSQIKGIIDYVKSKLFSHFWLYKAAFSEEFHQERKTVHFSLQSLKMAQEEEKNYDLNEGEEKVQAGEHKSQLSIQFDSYFQNENEEKKDVFKNICNKIKDTAKSEKVAILLHKKFTTIRERMEAKLYEKETELEKKLRDVEAHINSGVNVSKDDLKAIGLQH